MTLPLVLVLCTGNASRSQLAEAILRQALNGRARVVSAGTRPQPRVAAHALEALRLAGLPTRDLRSKDVALFLDQPIDLLVSVCDEARSDCPAFPRPVRRLHMPFRSPQGEPLESFVAVREDIRRRLVPAVREALGLERDEGEE
jgi:arsenate reductase